MKTYNINIVENKNSPILDNYGNKIIKSIPKINNFEKSINEEIISEFHNVLIIKDENEKHKISQFNIFKSVEVLFCYIIASLLILKNLKELSEKDRISDFENLSQFNDEKPVAPSHANNLISNLKKPKESFKNYECFKLDNVSGRKNEKNIVRLQKYCMNFFKKLFEKIINNFFLSRNQNLSLTTV